MKYVEGAKKLFMSTGTTFPREVIWSVALIKQLSAGANHSLGKLDDGTFRAISDAAQEVMDGAHDDQIGVDVFQTGSGTGINMNVNEAIAERASELAGKSVHPNDHVNMGQSSNDVVPTAIRVAAVSLARERMLPSLAGITASLTRLSAKTSSVYKSGRTHLRDAMPVTMGQEFGAYADAFTHDRRMVSDALGYVSELPLGGTAVGTGVNTDPRFGGMVIGELNRVTKLRFTEADDRFRAMRLLTDLVALSSALRVTALDLHRLCQDLRLMFSGPLTGLGELDLPKQAEVAGSSIMPGKTNPVTVEAALLVCSQVYGLDAANQSAATLGEFELSMGVPLMGYNVALQLKLLSEALNKVSSLVIDHVVPDRARLRAYAETSPSLITVLSPTIGYDRASAIGKKLSLGRSTRDALKEMGYSDGEIDGLLDMKKLVGRRRPGKRPKRS
ncbi:MAG: class II fumarate hydratase [Nitrososphaerales archaeon]|jgi:fumarate hydratase class II